MTLGPVPWLAMLEWARYHDLATPEFELLVAVVRIVDAEHLRRERARKP